MATTTKLFNRLIMATAVATAVTGCSQSQDEAPPKTAEDAQAYVLEAEQRIEDLYEYTAKASWVAQTYINEDTQYLESLANEQFKVLGIELANGAAQFNGMDLPEDTQRKLNLLRLRLTLPAPVARPELAAELDGIKS